MCHSTVLHHGDASVLSNNTVLPVEHNHGAQHPDQSDKQPFLLTHSMAQSHS